MDPSTALALFLVLHPAWGLQEAPPGETWVRAVGEVEIRPSLALTAAEEAARELLWNRFSPAWKEKAGFLVPEARLRSAIFSWMRDSFDRLPVVRPGSMLVHESTVGRAYRKDFALQVAGRGAGVFRREGGRVAEGLADLFRTRFILIALSWSLLVWLSMRLDRATRGWMTTRIRLGSLLCAVLSAVLLFPH